MGEHTIREILRRRSPETQRAMKRRRELAGVSNNSSTGPKLVLLVVILALLGYMGYLAWQAHDAGQRFATEKAAESQPLTLASTGEFLPNTLLASLDPAFYSPATLSGSALTRRLVRIYYPGVSSLGLRVMTVSIESQYSKTEIMESYINQAPMSGGAQPVKGLAAAATYYFGKSFAQLAPQDIALLVAMMSNPQGLDPRTVPEKAYDARNLVLQADLQQNVLSQAQVNNLSKMPLGVVPLPTANPIPTPTAAASKPAAH
jgi:hypothetical protein